MRIVAAHILDTIRSDPDSQYLSGMSRIQIGCCFGKRLDCDYGDDIALRKYLLTLNVDEFLNVLDDSHPHSGGDIDQIKITEYDPVDIIDLTN
jgi:hypothetical protein